MMTPQAAGVLAALGGSVAVLLWPARSGVGPVALRPAASWRRLVAGRPRRHRRAGEGADAVADVADLLGPALSVGASPGLALLAVLESLPDGSRLRAALPEVRASLEAGCPLSEAVLLGAGPRGSPDLAVLARGLALTESLGSALAPAVAVVAGILRDRAEADQLAEVAAAGPRATMRLLALLPLAGPAVGWVFGLDPTALYATGPAVLSCGVGLLASALGWWWSRSLLARATRPLAVR